MDSPMSPRLEGIQGIADLLGDTFVTMENHARSMGPAPGNYSTKIGRGHRNVELSPSWIVSTFLAGVRNDPKNAVTKVPELGNLVPGKMAYIQTRRIVFDKPPAGYNSLFPSDYVEERKVHPVFLEENHRDLFDFLCSLVLVAGHWLVRNVKEETCPIPNGLTIKITLEPEPAASVSFFISENQLIDGGARAVRYYNRSDSKFLFGDEDALVPLERTVVISHSHILRLGEIYALSLKDPKSQTDNDTKAKTNTSTKAKNKEADNPARLSAPSETLSHEVPVTTTGTQRKDSLTSSNPSPRVCVSSRGSAPKGYSHERTSYQHALL